MNCLSSIKEVKMIKKQTNKKIIISLMFILAIALGMGAVSASDVNTGDNPLDSASSDELVLIEISGQVEQCSDGEPFQGATVTVSDNGTQIASTTTSADGTYNVSFQSMKRVFTVTASANGHKPSTKTVSVNNNQETYTGTANFSLGNNDAYVYQGWGTNPDEDYTFSDGTTIHLTGATNAFTTINDGINYAMGNTGVNTVYIAPGTYNEYSMSIDTSVNLHGEDQATTIIDADDNARILTIGNNANVNIEQLTFRDGYSDMGGALRVESGTTTITDCTFDSNTVPGSGGAIYIDPGATATISGSTFTDNSADTGVAIYNGGTLTCTGSTFSGNTGRNGCGISNYGTLIVDSCIFTNNIATWIGGGIYHGSYSVSCTVTGSTFSGNNAARFGGAISCDTYAGSCTLTGNTFTDNTVTDNGGYGGAIRVRETLIAHYNRFYDNHATYGDAISSPAGTVDAENNWWGSNVDPKTINNLLVTDTGSIDADPWIILTVNASPDTINNRGTSTITADFNHINGGGELVGGHIPDGTPVTFATTLGSIPGTIFNTVDGIATATFTASQTSGTAYISGLIDSYQTPYDPNDPNTTPYTTVTINKAADLYIQITSDKQNPKVGETFTLTYKLGNNGPDAAENVVTTIPLPKGFHLSKISGDGTWTYDEATRTITWTMANVPVGDPYLYITGWFTRAGSYVFTASITSNTYNMNTQGVSALTVNAENVVQAKTIGMQETGAPIVPIVLALLLVIGGLLVPSRKK